MNDKPYCILILQQKLIVQIEKKTYNIDDDDSGKYRSALDLLKNILSVGSSCNSNNDNFENIGRLKEDEGEMCWVYYIIAGSWNSVPDIWTEFKI
jgi:hypothetical protein